LKRHTTRELPAGVYENLLAPDLDLTTGGTKLKVSVNRERGHINVRLLQDGRWYSIRFTRTATRTTAAKFHPNIKKAVKKLAGTILDCGNMPSFSATPSSHVVSAPVQAMDDEINAAMQDGWVPSETFFRRGSALQQSSLKHGEYCLTTFIENYRNLIATDKESHSGRPLSPESTAPSGCPICLEDILTIYTVVGGCGHKLCSKCFKSMQKNMRPPLCCPLCKRNKVFVCAELPGGIPWAQSVHPLY